MIAPDLTTADLEVQLAATPEQQAIIGYRGKFMCLLAGRRWGKTVGCVRPRIITRCLEQPGFKYLMVGPSYPQVVPEYEAISTHAALRDMGMIRKFQMLPYPRIIFRNGSEAAFRTLEHPHRLRREGYDEIWADEIQDVDERTVDAVLLPMLADRRGSFGMSGQPRGAECWYYRRFFVPGQSEKNWSWCKSWNYTIYDGLMFQTKRGREEIEMLRQVTPAATFEEEYLAVPVANGRAVFRGGDLAACTRGMCGAPVPGVRYIVAVDLGRTVDNTALVVFDSTNSAVVHAEVRPLREKHEITAELVKREIRKWNNAACLIDTTGTGRGSATRADEYVKAYQERVPSAVPFLWSPLTKRRMIDRLSLAIEQRIIAIPAQHKELLRQLAAYEFVRKGSQITFSAPAGDHDDLVAALAMAYDGHMTGWGGRPAAIGHLAGALA